MDCQRIDIAKVLLVSLIVLLKFSSLSICNSDRNAFIHHVVPSLMHILLDKFVIYNTLKCRLLYLFHVQNIKTQIRITEKTFVLEKSKVDQFGDMSCVNLI